MFQSHTPYRVWVPVAYVAGLVCVTGVFCPVPNSTMRYCAVEPAGLPEATTTWVVIGCPDGVVNRGPGETFQLVSVGAGQVEAPDVAEQVARIHVVGDVVAIEVGGRDIGDAVRVGGAALAGAQVVEGLSAAASGSTVMT